MGYPGRVSGIFRSQKSLCPPIQKPKIVLAALFQKPKKVLAPSFKEPKEVLREGAKIIGIYAGQDDGGASTFFAKKNEGAKTFSEEKNDGANAFLTKKVTGQRFFLTEINFTAFLLLMLSCLALDAVCVIFSDIVQFTTPNHCAES